MSILNSILRTSLEDAGLIDPVETEATSTPEELEEAQVEAAEAQVDAAEAEVEQNEQALDQMEVTAESLQRVYDRMAHYQANGTVSQEAADFMILAAKNALAPFGMESLIDQTMPSMEAFSGGSASATSLSVAMEGIGETLKKWWKAIKDFFVSIFNKVAEFFRKWFTFEGRLRTRVSKLKATVSKLSDKTVDKQKTIELNGMAADLYKGDYKQLKETVELNNVITEMLSKLPEINKFAEDAKVAALDDSITDQIAYMAKVPFNSIVDKFTTKSSVFVTEVTGREAESYGEGARVFDSPEFAGGVRFRQVVVDKTKYEDANAWEKIKSIVRSVGIKKIVKEDYKSEEKKAVPYDQKKLEDVLKGCDVVLAVADNVRKSTKFMDEQVKKIKSENVDKGAKLNMWRAQVFKTAVDAKYRTVYEMTNGVRTVSQYQLKMASAAADFVEKSIKAHK